jgi:hypothetical protein
MHQFQLLTATHAKLSSFTPRIEKHGDENVPAVSLGLTITGPNTLLDALQPGLRAALYTAPEGQEVLPGVEQSLPLLRSRALERIKLKVPDMEGWQLVIEHGIADDSAVDLHGCKVDGFVLEPFEGGSVELKFRVGTSDVDETYMGHLAMKLGQEVKITLHAPQPKPDAIDGTVEAFQKDHPDADKSAADLFQEVHGDDDDDGPTLDDEQPEAEAEPEQQPVKAGRRGRKSAAEVE